MLTWEFVFYTESILMRPIKNSLAAWLQTIRDNLLRISFKMKMKWKLCQIVWMQSKIVKYIYMVESRL